METNKDIVVSYAESDYEYAERLYSVFKQLFGERIWFRHFDLNGGDLILETIREAYSESKWLIILLSNSSTESKWLQQEANFATWRALNADDFQIVTVFLEDCQVPKHLEIPVRNGYTLELWNHADKENGFIELANYINEYGNTKSQHEIYEGRGLDTDKSSLVLKRNKIVFFIGWRGIGKTAFVENSLSGVLGKDPRIIKLTNGHSEDLLARQIIKEMHVFHQPIGNGEPTDAKLIAQAISAMRERERNFFLVLDNAQMGMDGSNRLLPYLQKFLNIFIESNVDTKVILATTRSPHVNSLPDFTGIYRLRTIENEFIEDIVSQWLENTEHQEEWINRLDDRKHLVHTIAGHPLAARRMALYIQLKSINHLLEETNKEGFQVNLADYILRTTQQTLDNLQSLLMRILAIIREPVSTSDLIQIPTLNNEYGISDIHTALGKLYELSLIEQDGELMYLHDFLNAYYSRQLRTDERLRRQVAREYGMYAYKQTLDYFTKLEYEQEKTKYNDTNKIINLSNTVFRYATVADRLLRLIKKEDLADRLPIRTKGTLRGLVYFFYQDVKDYTTALDYAERWLKLNPDDSDIRLYQIRCYRRLGTRDAKSQALLLIEQMEKDNPGQRVKVRLLRERALLVQYDNPNMAKSIYQEAMRTDSRWKPYSDIYAEYARLLIKEADNLPDWSPQKQEIAKEAVEKLEIAKEEPDNFYRYHLDAYVEGLIQSGQFEKAYPLLEEALSYNENDPRLNFRMAEIKRRNKEFEASYNYAQAASDAGFAPALITHASALYDHALELQNSRKTHAQSRQLLHEALQKVNLRLNLPNTSDSEIEVAYTVQAKILRKMNRLQDAEKALLRYKNSSNPYTIYEMSTICLSRADEKATRGHYADALVEVEKALQFIQNYKNELPDPLDNLLTEANQKQITFHDALGL